MKKLLALMVAMIMVLGLAGFAAAEIELSGDARVRGTMKSNPDYDSDTDDDSRWYDDRIRLKVKGTNDDGAGVMLQFTATEQAWDGATTGIRYDGDDYAYLFLPVADNWTLYAGFMPANWGHKFWGWGSANNRLKLVGKLDAVTVGLMTQKADDTFGTDDLNDYDKNYVFVIGQAGDFKVGAIALSANDATTGGGGTGNMFDVYFQGNVGDITILGELAQKGGDLYESSEGDSQTGMFIAAAMDVDAFKVSGGIATTQNGYVATGYFTPTVLIGTSQPSAQFNLGQCGFGDDMAAALVGVGATSTCDTLALVLSADTKLSDEMGLGATVAYATADGYGDLDGAEGTWTEVDAKFSYTLGEATKYWANFGYGILDIDDADLDPMYAITHGVSLKF